METAATLFAKEPQNFQFPNTCFTYSVFILERGSKQVRGEGGQGNCAMIRVK
jgi:hypothetical protein